MMNDFENEAKLKEENDHLNKYIKWFQGNHRRRYDIIKKTDLLLLEILMLRNSHNIEKDFESAKKSMEDLRELIKKEAESKPQP